MRGALGTRHRKDKIMGIIPAYAGSTGTSQKPSNHNGDHPRVCGEHLTAIDPALWPAGSSPRMRGAL